MSDEVLLLYHTIMLYFLFIRQLVVVATLPLVLNEQQMNSGLMPSVLSLHRPFPWLPGYHKPLNYLYNIAVFWSNGITIVVVRVFLVRAHT